MGQPYDPDSAYVPKVVLAYADLSRNVDTSTMRWDENRASRRRQGHGQFGVEAMQPARVTCTEKDRFAAHRSPFETFREGVKRGNCTIRINHILTGSMPRVR
jgi:hypothetical protein